MNEVQTLHEPFIDFLNEAGIPFIRARSDRESTIALGHPDFTLLLGNHSLCIEFKTKGGKLTREQVDRIAELRKTGTTVHVVRDLGIAIELTKAWQSMIGVVVQAEEPEDAPVKVEIPVGLFRHGSGVFHRVGSQYEWVRKATPEDVHLPNLLAAA